jgi:hypothetical protein
MSAFFESRVRVPLRIFDHKNVSIFYHIFLRTICFFHSEQVYSINEETSCFLLLWEKQQLFSLSSDTWDMQRKLEKHFHHETLQINQKFSKEQQQLLWFNWNLCSVVSQCMQTENIVGLQLNVAKKARARFDCFVYSCLLLLHERERSTDVLLRVFYVTRSIMLFVKVPKLFSKLKTLRQVCGNKKYKHTWLKRIHFLNLCSEQVFEMVTNAFDKWKKDSILEFKIKFCDFV